MIRFENKRVLVTGATRGLGWSIASAFLDAGANVIVNGRDGATLDVVGNRLAQDHAGHVDVACFDISDLAQQEGRAADCIRFLPRVDILINNVAMRCRKPIAAMDLDEIRAVLNTNLIGPMQLARALFDGHNHPPGACIVNMTSIAGELARSGDAIYTASKGGLTALTRALAAEFGSRGVRVNAIAPGFFATESNEAMRSDESVVTLVRDRVSLGRWGDPSEVAGPCLFLASSAASYITGEVLHVDGGFSSHF
ncbi:MAG: gluconate 5-dehydrogenase [Gammaproteobacteria bacterium]|nr:gluconate 5-dehydrogenase [Gammaproteobacteria bacterium]|tara:strand:+ start:15560 stop:16318 length:759 start_codon:yes stop_codon:yes gene_type:complete